MVTHIVYKFDPRKHRAAGIRNYMIAAEKVGKKTRNLLAENGKFSSSTDIPEMIF